MTDRCFLMESCPSWSKEHDWKSCNESTLIRGFESLALRHQVDTKKMYPEKTSVLPRFFAFCRAVFSS